MSDCSFSNVAQAMGFNSDKQEQELVMSIATMHYLRAVRNASVNGKIDSFKAPTKLELIVTVPTHVGAGDVDHPASEFQCPFG